MTVDGGDADILAWLEAHRAAWNADDVPGMFAAVGPDLHWVNVVGMHWQGEAQTVGAHQAFFRQMFAGVPLDLDAVESIVDIGGGVRVAVARWTLGDYVTPGGETVRGEHNRMTLVFSGHGPALRLRHVANVRIDAAAAPHDPAAKR